MLKKMREFKEEERKYWEGSPKRPYNYFLHQSKAGEEVTNFLVCGTLGERLMNALIEVATVMDCPLDIFLQDIFATGVQEVLRITRKAMKDADEVRRERDEEVAERVRRNLGASEVNVIPIPINDAILKKLEKMLRDEGLIPPEDEKQYN